MSDQLDLATSTSAVEEISTASAVASGDIVVTDAVKVFGVTRALDGCSFSARLGEIHAIIGGNGCGKSTMAKVISGVLPIDSGHVSILGHTPTTPREARAAGIATVFQEVLVADDASVQDNLFVGADSLFKKALPAREKYETSEKIMRELAGFHVDPDALVGDLPLSLKQWITIGRALLRKPKVLILDESSAALDFDSTERLFAKMRELRNAGSTVLIVTHRIAELIRISDRATVMRDGKDVGVLEKGEITEENLLRLMTGKDSPKEAERIVQQQIEREDIVMKARDLKVWPDGDEINFDLHEGEIVGVAGLDGQGQNEFVRVLAGVQASEQGVPQVKVDRQSDFDELRDLLDARRCKVSYVSGDRKREGIFPNLSIFENLSIAIYPKTLKARIANIIDWASLKTVFEQNVDKLSIKIGLPSDKITSLSGGNQQKVLIGRAFAMKPNILVLNDPARGIDVEAKRELYGHLRDFSKRGQSVIFLSSELEEFIGLCHRVIVFRHGAVFATFLGEEIEPVRILEAMFGRTAEDKHGKSKPAETGAAPSHSQDKDDKKQAPLLDTDRRPAWRMPTTRQIKVVDFGKSDPAKTSGDDSSTQREDAGPDSRKIKIVYSDR